MTTRTHTILLIVSIPISLLQYLLYGAVFSVLWDWYVQSFFHLARMSVSESIGIIVLVSLLAHTYVPVKDNYSLHDYLVRQVDVTLVPLFAIGFGWFFHLFV